MNKLHELNLKIKSIQNKLNTMAYLNEGERKELLYKLHTLMMYADQVRKEIRASVA